MSDTSGQDSNQDSTSWHAPFSIPKTGSFSQADPTSGNNGIFSNPTFQKLLQKTIGLVAQLHGGQDPNAAQAGGQPQGAGMMSPQTTSGGPAAALQAAPQVGGGSGGGQGSAPPPGATGQTLGAPQMPQQGYGGWGQPAAPPMQQGPGTQGSVTNIQPQQNFSQAPWMAGPLNDYGAFSKANPMPKQPTYDDAIDAAEKIRQGTVGGSMQPGAGGGIGTSPGLVDQVMKSMNQQYSEQLKAHTGAWTGQVAAGHAHNQSMAEAEHERHNRAQEAQGSQRIGDTEHKNEQQQSNADRKFYGMSAAQQSRADQAKKNQDDLMDRATSAATAKERGEAAKALAKQYDDNLKWITTQSFAAQAAGDTAAEQKASDAAGALGPPPGGAPTAQKPQAPPEAVAYLKAHPEMKKAFEEKYAPVQ